MKRSGLRGVSFNRKRCCGSDKARHDRLLVRRLSGIVNPLSGRLDRTRPYERREKASENGLARTRAYETKRLPRNSSLYSL